MPQPQPDPLTVDDLRRPGHPDVITVAQLAPIMHVSTDALYEAIAADSLPFPAVRLGRCIRIPVVPLLRALGYESEAAGTSTDPDEKE